MIKISRQAYKSAWIAAIAVIVVGWAAFGIAHDPGKGWLWFMIALTVVLLGAVAGLLRPTTDDAMPSRAA
jgi:hypothetical protein